LCDRVAAKNLGEVLANFFCSDVVVVGRAELGVLDDGLFD